MNIVYEILNFSFTLLETYELLPVGVMPGRMSLTQQRICHLYTSYARCTIYIPSGIRNICTSCGFDLRLRLWIFYAFVN